MNNENDKNFLEYVARELVDHKEEVKVERRVDELGVLLTLSVHPEDMGRVIGKDGATAHAIRAILRIIGTKAGSRVNLKILDPRRGEN